jgi:hypothetical protein
VRDWIKSIGYVCFGSLNQMSRDIGTEHATPDKIEGRP